MSGLLFPGRLRKALTFSFDDGEWYDGRLARLLRQFGAKATFYLISGQLGARIPHTRYGRDTVVRRVAAEELPAIYAGMEVGSHTASHRLFADTVEADVVASAQMLAACGAGPVVGLAYPGGVYTEAVLAALMKTDILYARTTAYTHDFALPDRLLCWHPTCRYDDPAAEGLADAFLAADEGVFHLMGHAYELERPEAGWASFAALLKRLCGRADIWNATNGEIAGHLIKAGWKR